MMRKKPPDPPIAASVTPAPSVVSDSLTCSSIEVDDDVALSAPCTKPVSSPDSNVATLSSNSIHEVTSELTNGVPVSVTPLFQGSVTCPREAPSSSDRLAIEYLGKDRLRTFSEVDFSKFQVKISLSNNLKTFTNVPPALLDSGADDNFMSPECAKSLGLQLSPLASCVSLQIADGSSIPAVTHETENLTLKIGNDVTTIRFLIAELNHPIILGLPWLRQFNPKIDWKTKTLEFPLNTQDHSTSIPIVSTISPRQFRQLSQEVGTQVGIFVISKDSKLLKDSVPENADASQLLSDFEDVFSQEAANDAFRQPRPSTRDFECSIPIEPDKEPPFGALYNLSEPERIAMETYVKENLKKGWISHSTSPAGAPCFFIKKKDGSLRLCIDYRGLNKITVKNRLAIPLISDLISRLSTAKLFSTLDLRNAYQLVKIKEADRWKTAFRTHVGHFEYNVMPFGLTNAPAIFQDLMNETLKDYIGKFVCVYLDDILIYSQSPEDHKEHLRLVLQRLRDFNLFCKKEKCHLFQNQITFLGYVISSNGISMDESKVSSIVSWPIPTSVRDVQSFLGLSNFYRRFIPNYSAIAKPLTSLLRKNTVFSWSSSAQEAFEALKTAFTEAPILAHPDSTLPYIVETDASAFAISGILSQRHGSTLRPVAFFSRQLIPAERNYPVYDQELLAIYEGFRTWRHFLQGAQHPVQVFCDHKNLTYFMTSRQLNGRQARWALFFGDFDFTVHYRPGSKNGKADALSRRSDYKEGKDSDSNLVLLMRPMTVSTISNSSFLDLVKTATLDDAFAQSVRNNPEFRFENDLLFKGQKLYVPTTDLQLQVLKIRHDSPSAGHFGVRKTYELCKRDYFWPNMIDTVKKYLSDCDCQRSKSSRHSPYGLLQPIAIPERNWGTVTSDFVGELPSSNGFNAIQVWLCKRSKMVHFAPTTTTVTAEESARLFVQNVFKLHGLPDAFISDRGPQFRAQFWKSLCSTLGIDARLSTAFHPQTNGQTERMNQVLEQYLRNFINYHQDDWSAWLPLAEFAINNSSIVGELSPFYVNYGSHPKFDPSLIGLTSHVPSVQDMASHMKQISEELQEILVKSQERLKFYADQKRSPIPDWKIGDKVWLNAKNLKTQRPSKKLDFKKLGPFEIVSKIGSSSFKLRLPDTMKIHDVFHASLLESFVPSGLPKRTLPPPPPVVIDDETEYEVEEILDSKLIRKKLHYLVRWKGFDPSSDSWESYANVKNCGELLQEFHARYPSKPKLKSVSARSSST
jgi:transposase InsO family protein